MNPTTSPLQTAHQELDRLLHRRGDIDTMLDDCNARAAALELERADVRGAIAATRARMGQLEQEARQQQPQFVAPGEQPPQALAAVPKK